MRYYSDYSDYSTTGGTYYKSTAQYDYWTQTASSLTTKSYTTIPYAGTGWTSTGWIDASSTYLYISPSEQQPESAEVIRQREDIKRRNEPLERWREWREKRSMELQKKAEAEARDRARILLLEYLDEENRQRYLEKKPVEVVSQLFGEVKYQIPVLDGRIRALKHDRVISELCIRVTAGEWLPEEDIVLAKLLLLQIDEADAVRIANHFNVKEDMLAALSCKQLPSKDGSIKISSRPTEVCRSSYR